jgi:signal transduction histidine kinase
VVREAVINAARHGGAQRIRVHMRDRPDLYLSVRDDGHGFDTASPRAGRIGLESMRARVEGIGGQLAILSEPGGGTEVRVRLP